MKRRSPVIVAAILALGMGALAYRESQRMEHTKSDGSSEGEPEKSEKGADIAADPHQSDPGDLLPTSAALPTLGSSRFNLMPDGSAVPPLPEGAPTKVKLGIAIFRYQGAQSPPESRRTKKEAEELAKKAIAAAKVEFIEAVKMGDMGSHENIGWIGQGVLEKSVEYAVFTTDKDTLASAPIDTPRGYWVIKRVR